MTVQPGFGGQKFMDNQLEKISKISKEAAKLKKDVIISVDGGINDVTARLATKNGANMLLSGSWLFKQPSIEKAVLDLKKII
jgi:ribulose-phosphate 3-epimerase